MATREVINNGTTANDGTGDTLRQAATKINNNFAELFVAIGGDSDTFNQTVTFGDNTIVFEGATGDDFETSLTVIDPTQDNTITFPDSSGQVVLRNTIDVLINKTINHMNINGRLCFGDSENSVSQYFIKAGNLQASYDLHIPVITDSDTFTLNNTASTLKNKTLNSPILKSPIVGAKLLDSAGAEILVFTKASSAVNHVDIRNSATGSAPSIRATGDDTNIALQLHSKGTGLVTVSTGISFNSETVTSTTACSLLVPTTVFSAGGAITPTLANGTVVGQLKFFVNKNSGVATLTPTSFGPGSSIALDQNDTATLIWDGSDWQIQATYGGTVA